MIGIDMIERIKCIYAELASEDLAERVRTMEKLDAVKILDRLLDLVHSEEKESVAGKYYRCYTLAYCGLIYGDIALSTHMTLHDLDALIGSVTRLAAKFAAGHVKLYRITLTRPEETKEKFIIQSSYPEDASSILNLVSISDLDRGASMKIDQIKLDQWAFIQILDMLLDANNWKEADRTHPTSGFVFDQRCFNKFFEGGTNANPS